MTVAPGDRLSHYILDRKIGEGGMGVVWKATDDRLGRVVAIKMLTEALEADPQRIARIQSEARAVAALNHPGIVTIHSIEECDGRHFIVMEFVDGEPLDTMIPDEGLPLDRLLRLGLAMVDAVSVAHERGISHRDLKPRNIVVHSDDRLKILDFGLAKATGEDPMPSSGEEATKTLPIAGYVTGTMPYMAPEQIKSEIVDQRADLFSLGVILHEMATGSRPFDGATPAELIAGILRDEPRSVSELRRGLPRQLGRIVLHALEKDPRQRFQTALDLRNELQRLEEELGRRDSGREIRSIAVLPLDDLSGDPEQAYFADGMTDALINSLGRIGALKVISRTSVMQYKGVRKPLPEIARELGVDSIVEGSVLRAGDRIRVTAQLIDAPRDELLWAQSYALGVGDMLSLQSRTAKTIAARIEIELTPQEHARLEEAAPVDPAVHEACLKGRHFWYKRTTETVRKGLRCFERALALDPNYAPAHAGVADSYIVDGGRYLGVTPEIAYGRAREAALQATTLDDGLAEAHTSLAAVMTDYDWDWEGADREYRRAIELNPNYVTAHSWYAEHLSRMGRHDEAIIEARRARELDPLSLASSMIVAWILYFARRHDEAIAQARSTLELDGNYATALRILGWAYEETGEYVEAIRVHRRAAKLGGGQPNFTAQLGRAYALAERHDDAKRILDDLLEQSKTAYISSLDIAIIHAALGEEDEALDRLEQAFAERADHLPYIKVNPRLDGLRGTPRFESVLRRMGLAN